MFLFFPVLQSVIIFLLCMLSVLNRSFYVKTFAHKHFSDNEYLAGDREVFLEKMLLKHLETSRKLGIKCKLMTPDVKVHSAKKNAKLRSENMD